MAKTMGLLEDNVIVNLLWCSNSEEETDTLKEVGDYELRIGDTFEDGKWYRDGFELLAPLEEAELKAAEYYNSLTELVEEVYQSDMEMMGI